MLPDANGFDVLRELKADGQTARIPVIMMSVQDAQERGYQLGAMDYLTKPVDRERLLEALRRCCPPEAPRKVLIVEDDEATRSVMEKTLRGAGWEVWSAVEGESALAQLSSNGKPSVILLDLMMEGMDGFAFIEALRKVDPERRIPVVVVTSKDLTEQDRRRMNGRVVELVAKGDYPLESLGREIKRRLERWE
jgi:CheY-like chemotaxis protein